MPKDIKMPDGVVVRFPDSMSDDEIRAKILKKFPDVGKGAPKGDAPAEPAGEPVMTIDPAGAEPPTEEPAPAQEGNPLVSAIGNTAAFLNNMADTASFGLAPAIQRTVLNAFNPGSGDALQRDIDYTNQQNPAGSVAGFAAGIPLGAVATGPAAAVVGNTSRIGNAFIQGGGRFGNFARSAGIGGASGAVEAATHGEDPLAGGIVGTLAGPVADVVAKPVIETAKRVLPQINSEARRAWRYVADKLGASPDELERRVQAYMVQNNGRQPSLQQIVSDHDAGVLAEVGTIMPHAGQELRRGAREAAADVPVPGAGRPLPNAPTLLQAVTPENVSLTTLLDARDAATDTAVDAIRNNPATLPSALVDDIIRVTGMQNSRKWGPVAERLSDGTATIDDIDKVRKRLSKMNSTEFSADVDDVLTDLRAAAPAEYTQIMDDYAAASRYIDAFRLGRGGTARGSVTDAGERASLRSAEGNAGYTLGESMREGADRARSAAPSSLRPATEPGMTQLGTAAADVAIGAPISGARQAMQGFERILKGLNISPAAQRQIGTLLASKTPRDVETALRQLRAAGADEQTIRRARLIAAQALSEKSTETLLQTEDQ